MANALVGGEIASLGSVLTQAGPRTLSVLPCSASAWCTEHSLGHNQPQAVIGTSGYSLWTTISAYLPFLAFKSQSPQCHLITLLPVEILREIFLYLTLPERIAIALTSKALYSAVGTHEFVKLKDKSNENELINLLTLLQRDSRTHRLCQSCKILHSPTHSTITLPPNKLRRQKLHPTVQVYILAPHVQGSGSILFWLTDEHFWLAVSKQICIHTLRCKGSASLARALPSVPALHNTTFKYHFHPIVNRGDVVFHAKYLIEFPCAPQQYWSHEYVKILLGYFDIRCCLHCPKDHLLDEMICFLYHGREVVRPRQGMLPSCARARMPPFSDGEDDNVSSMGDGCGHVRRHDCDCATEYTIESITHHLGQRFDVPVGVKVKVWQWLGNRKDDYVLKIGGMLRNLYEDAALGEG